MSRNKMLHYMRLVLLLLLPSVVATGQGFDRVYSFSPYPEQDLYSYWQTIYADSQLIFVAGQTFKDSFEDPTTINNMAVLAAFDYSGNVQWEKPVSFASPPYASGGLNRTHLITKLGNDKFVLAGYGWDCETEIIPGYCFPRPFLYFFNAQGDSLDFISIPHGALENISVPNSVVQDKQGNLVVVGKFSNTVFADTFATWMAKYTPSGDFLWRKLILNQEDVGLGIEAYKVVACNDGSGYLLMSRAWTIDSTVNTLFALTKTDTAGNVVWQKQLPRAFNEGGFTHFISFDQFVDITPANNGSGYYFMAADLQRVEFPVEGTGYLPIYYCGKLDEQGEVIWAKTYKRDTLHREFCRSVQQQANGDLVFLGISITWDQSPQGQMGTGTSLFSTDSLGNVKWFRVLRRYLCTYSVAHGMYSMDLSPQGDIAMGGYINQSNPQPGCYDTSDVIAWLVLTDSLGHRNPSDTATFTLKEDSVIYPVDTTTSIVLIEDKDRPQLRLYPNPAGNTVYAELLNIAPGNGKALLLLYDYLGRKLQEQTIQKSKTTIDISTYPPGLYYIRLRYGDKDIGGYKLVKQ